MNVNGDAELLVRARSALLDALEALKDHRGSVVLIGAQAIYLHTGSGTLALAEATKDSDLALDPRTLNDEPLIEQLMRDADFELDKTNPQPGAWKNSEGVPVDLMVPEALAGPGGRRSARIPPHDHHATRRAVGLEAAIVDHSPMRVGALMPRDTRAFTVQVASPAALLVAKLHKLGEREEQTDRLVDKDAHDVYRLLVLLPSERFVTSLLRLAQDPLAGDPTERALAYLERLFAAGPEALGSLMAGRAEEGVGDPDVVAASVAALSQVIVAALTART